MYSRAKFNKMLSSSRTQTYFLFQYDLYFKIIPTIKQFVKTSCITGSDHGKNG